MTKTVKSILQSGVIFVMCLFLFNLQQVWADGNIDSTYKYAWSENSGWENFRSTYGGVTVNDAYLSGYAWAENIGWIKLGSGTGPYENTTSANWGVNHDSSTGALSGYAWSENVGWINFNETVNNPNGVSIATDTLKFSGYAWAENVGYIHFRNATPEYYVMQEGVAPTVTTQALSNITATTATVNGNITDLGMPDPTEHGVCWSTSESPTTGDAKTEQGPASVTGAFTSSITGLAAGTKYYVRAYAENTAGTSYGGEVSFTTLPNPSSVPTATAATSVVETSFSANWDAATGATAYRLDVSTKSDFSSYVTGYQDKDVGKVTTSSVTGLTGGTAYYYRVRGVNAGGMSGDSNTITVTTLSPAPVATDATSITQTGFSANWNVSTGATGYRLDVSTQSDFSSYVSGYQNKDVGDVTTSSVTGFTDGTTYYFRVRAENGTGTSANSNTISATTLAAPTRVNLTGPSTMNVGTISTAFTLTSQDGDGNPANVTENTVFSLTSNSTGATFYSDAAGTAAITQVTIPNGSNTATFYYKDTAAGTPTVTATRTSGMELGSDSHQVTVNPGPQAAFAVPVMDRVGLILFGLFTALTAFYALRRHSA